jgi:hypothetical protein
MKDDLENLTTSLENLDLKSTNFDDTEFGNFDTTAFTDTFGELTLTVDDEVTQPDGYQAEQEEEEFDFGL